MPTLNSRAIKATIVLDPAELASMPDPVGVPCINLRIRTPDRTVTADLNAKSVRKARSVIEAAGEEGVALILQGKLVAGDVLAEAGLVAQPRVRRPAEAA